jgi:L-seryl-tRNA(Ser) seleniumtransferase
MLDIYKRLGVKTYINAYSTVTKYGGSIMLPEVLDAMKEASKRYVELADLQKRASKRIADLLDIEAAYITCGAAAGIVISVAACIAGKDSEKIKMLPNTDALEKNEIILLRSHLCHYEQQIRQAGGKLVEIGYSDETYLWELEKAISKKTAAVFYFAERENTLGSMPIKDIIKTTHKYGVPVLVDAAAELPPLGNLTKFLKMGSDLVMLSGGKDIRGPQSSGLILGKKDLIEACVLNGVPNSSIGRPLKVDKETIVGLLKAIELYIEQDFEEEMRIWNEQIDYFVTELSTIPFLQVKKGFGISPGCQPENIPRAYVTWDEEKVGLTKEDVVKMLKEGEPGIVVRPSPKKGIELKPHMLDKGEEKIITARIKEIFVKEKWVNGHL